jgi:hypothetical protein
MNPNVEQERIDADPVMHRIGEALNAGWTYTEMSEAWGVSRAVISNLHVRRSHLVTRNVLNKILAAPMPRPDRTRNLWRLEAACAGMDVNLFVPANRGAEPHPDAVAACARCPVRDDCRNDTLTDDHTFRGGMTQQQRRQYRRRQKAANR